VELTTHPASAQVKERVELYLYSPHLGLHILFYCEPATYVYLVALTFREQIKLMLTTHLARHQYSGDKVEHSWK
jgi:hypothetical protein